jgi:dihydrofolate synthase/folylpolyglutamate synthase
MTPRECREYLRALERFGVKLGLDNIRALLGALGDPHRAFPSVHVAGTNGKGSVCAMLESILRAHGRRAGLYTSPHLVDVRERIRIGGSLIPRSDFARLLGRIRSTIEVLRTAGRLDAPPTYFEVLTTLAFLYFAEKKVDIAVLETGLGGRFDATNVVTPLLSVITSISKDHQEYLGRTLAAIAFEKAGIIKPGVPLVCGVETGVASRVIRNRARELGAPWLPVFGCGGALDETKHPSGRRFRYELKGEVFEFSPGLRGTHQGVNAAVVVAAVRALHRVWRPFDHQAIVRGIETVEWEGRLETVSKRPLVLLDGAHNEDGARALAAYVREEISGPLVLVFAMMRDKAVRRAAELLFPRPKKVILTSIPFARAAAAEEILAAAPRFRRKIILEPVLAAALARAKREAGPRGTVLVAGSLYLVGEVKKILC